MHNGGKVIIGLIVFLSLISIPVWYDDAASLVGGEVEERLKPENEASGERCVLDSTGTWMKVHHMDVLDEWRDQVVRDGKRFETGPDGKPVELSLTMTCLSCHQNKDRFCDRCHDDLGVDPYCWDCHVIPKEVER